MRFLSRVRDGLAQSGNLEALLPNMRPGAGGAQDRRLRFLDGRSFSPPGPGPRLRRGTIFRRSREQHIVLVIRPFLAGRGSRTVDMGSKHPAADAGERVSRHARHADSAPGAGRSLARAGRVSLCAGKSAAGPSGATAAPTSPNRAITYRRACRLRQRLLAKCPPPPPRQHSIDTLSFTSAAIGVWGDRYRRFFSHWASVPSGIDSPSVGTFTHGGHGRLFLKLDCADAAMWCDARARQQSRPPARRHGALQARWPGSGGGRAGVAGRA